jgi:hypothetical protein
MRLELENGGQLFLHRRGGQCQVCQKDRRELARMAVMNEPGHVDICGPCLAGAVAIRLTALHVGEVGAGGLADIERERELRRRPPPDAAPR